MHESLNRVGLEVLGCWIQPPIYEHGQDKFYTLQMTTVFRKLISSDNVIFFAKT